MKTPSVDDLLLAADWLAEYSDGDETSPGGETDQAAITIHMVGRWLRREAIKRHRAEMVKVFDNEARERGHNPVGKEWAKIRTHWLDQNWPLDEED